MTRAAVDDRTCKRIGVWPHESCQSWGSRKSMDYYNNYVGRQLGAGVGWHWTPWPTLGKACMGALNSGRLWIIWR